MERKAEEEAKAMVLAVVLDYSGVQARWSGSG
jgi:hypothetical protein